jgi:formylglycine-generating enzyme required for sulfatase activity
LTTTPYPWGDDISKNNSNCDGCGSKWDNIQTAPVGSFAPNKFGLCDMGGNGWEWTKDCAHKDYNGAPADGSAWLEANGGDCSNRTLRGSSWLAAPRYLRAANRDWYPSGTRTLAIPLRVGRTLLAP